MNDERHKNRCDYWSGNNGIRHCFRQFISGKKGYFSRLEVYDCSQETLNMPDEKKWQEVNSRDEALAIRQEGHFLFVRGIVGNNTSAAPIEIRRRFAPTPEFGLGDVLRPQAAGEARPEIAPTIGTIRKDKGYKGVRLTH